MPIPAKRPYDYRQDVADEICQLLIGGMSLRTITKSEAFPVQSRVYQWLAENPVFQEQYTRARELQADAIFDECMDISDEASNDFKVDDEGRVIIDHDAVARAKLRIDTRKWMAGKMRPKKYGDKIQVGGADDLPPVRTQSTLDVSGATLEQLEALQALLAGKQE